MLVLCDVYVVQVILLNITVWHLHCGTNIPTTTCLNNFRSCYNKCIKSFLGAMQICIARTTYGNVSGWVSGWLSVTAGIVSKRLNLS